MPPKKSQASAKKKTANGYSRPEAVPEGEIIVTLSKSKWRTGRPIGSGGFGDLYLCHPDSNGPVKEDAKFALKIEPHENGPLFVEINFYLRAATPDAVEEFKKARKLNDFGMPCIRGSGSHELHGKKYRFLIMDRFGKDLESFFHAGKDPFSAQLSYHLAIKVLDVLEYIHSKEFVHNDIKPQNMLLGFGKGSESTVFLVDYGLASKYIRAGVHLEYKPDVKKAHDGTIEYTSRDAHIGIHSRRSDLEILGYNLVHWMSGTLPWMKALANPSSVHNMKKDSMDNVDTFLSQCFGRDSPVALKQYLDYVNSLKFEQGPDYERCRGIFRQALKNAGHPVSQQLDVLAALSSSQTCPAAAAPASAKKSRGAKASPARSPRKILTATNKKLNRKEALRVTDSATQTSPDFVRAARAVARAKRQAAASAALPSEVDAFSRDAMTAAKVATSKHAAKRCKMSSEGENHLSTPTPAMLEVLKKRDATTPSRGKK